MNITFEHNVYDRLQGKYHLQPVFNDVHDIARVLREYDEQLFIVFNSRRRRYEVHTLGNRGNTYACDVPNNRLDSRVIKEIRRGDLRIRGKEIFREVEDWNERIERMAEQHRRDELAAVAGDMKSSFSRLAWEGL